MIKQSVEFSYEDIECAHEEVKRDSQYGREECMLAHIIQMHPQNDDLEWIAIKVSVVDLTNSTQLNNYKSKLSLYDISKIILELNIDEDIQYGNAEVIQRIAKRCKHFPDMDKGVNLFSFASKYCAYHNMYAYGRDDFSIFDNVVSTNLFRFATELNPLKKMTPETWRQNIEYQEYNNYIGNLLDEKGITQDKYPHRRRMFDHFVWYKNRTKENNHN